MDGGCCTYRKPAPHPDRSDHMPSLFARMGKPPSVPRWILSLRHTFTSGSAALAIGGRCNFVQPSRSRQCRGSTRQNEASRHCGRPGVAGYAMPTGDALVTLEPRTTPIGNKACRCSRTRRGRTRRRSSRRLAAMLSQVMLRPMSPASRTSSGRARALPATRKRRQSARAAGGADRRTEPAQAVQRRAPLAFLNVPLPPDARARPSRQAACQCSRRCAATCRQGAEAEGRPLRRCSSTADLDALRGQAHHADERNAVVDRCGRAKNAPTTIGRRHRPAHEMARWSVGSHQRACQLSSIARDSMHWLGSSCTVAKKRSGRPARARERRPRPLARVNTAAGDGANGIQIARCGRANWTTSASKRQRLLIRRIRDISGTDPVTTTSRTAAHHSPRCARQSPA